MAPAPPAGPLGSPSAPVSADSSLWDRISTWVSEHKAVVYTIAGVAVVITTAGAVYYIRSAPDEVCRFSSSLPCSVSPPALPLTLDPPSRRQHHVLARRSAGNGSRPRRRPKPRSLRRLLRLLRPPRLPPSRLPTSCPRSTRTRSKRSRSPSARSMPRS